ncbi:sigma-70 family RNA polymerase sigma factor [Verrucomicrobiaceae bacterium 5K15]|uniref:Sigma-70 family RNA polymerase sigma factor n=1 Tax=Oceaniferula flava TaxID=2800421 RepID=A0AAE2VD00_9BACT|nr:sigma-70 family RNA polymerase sigma factor [Oceaniferula flavus]MBK1853919.1 sigma-70 family RNA polymerase sigma factor [Oceaniferula flavus]MBM1135225.1 sigma-70 family RNA polymerase sigma factor [Oceaniferula flavus]
MDTENNKSVTQATASISNLPQGASIDADGKRQHSTTEGYAWDAWLRENGSRLLLFARQQTRSSEDAEDVFQDALVKLARKIDEGVFDGGQEAWKPYLYTTIRRLSIDLGRKNDRRSKREEKSEADRRGETGGVIDPWFDGDGSNDETRQLLEEGLKKLPTKFSEVIVMKIWGENTFAEIGEILGVSLNTVASRYRYGLERLRKSLEGARQNEDL